MVTYKCNHCNYVTKHKGNYERHLSKKKSCSNTDTNMVITNKQNVVRSSLAPYGSEKLSLALNSDKDEKSENDCIYCGKVFSKRSNLNRHMELNCKVMNFEIGKLKDAKSKLENENMELKEKVKSLETELINKPTTINNTININAYGNENISYITSSFANKLIEAPYTAIPNIIKSIHFHPEYPENHNIRITNKKEPYAKVYQNNKWVLTDKTELIEGLVDKGKNILDDHRDENLHSEFKNKCYNDFSEGICDENGELVKKTSKDVELLIINHS